MDIKLYGIKAKEEIEVEESKEEVVGSKRNGRRWRLAHGCNQSFVGSACKANSKEKLFLKSSQCFKKNKKTKQKNHWQITQTDDIKITVWIVSVKFLWNWILKSNYEHYFQSRKFFSY